MEAQTSGEESTDLIEISQRIGESKDFVARMEGMDLSVSNVANIKVNS